jgi:hypothetical protein
MVDIKLIVAEMMLPGYRNAIVQKELKAYLEARGYEMLTEKTFPDKFFWKK